MPPHWSRYEGRRSVLTSSNSNRKAERPMNVLLNYVYALVEVEAILACQAVGLDPGLGIVHSDTRGRQSLALDVMEPVRPEVDAFVLDLVEQRTFRKVEFVETSDGHVRLRSPLTHDLAETMPRWAQLLAPIAEHIAHVLGLNSGRRRRRRGRNLLRTQSSRLGAADRGWLGVSHRAGTSRTRYLLHGDEYDPRQSNRTATFRLRP